MIPRSFERIATPLPENRDHNSAEMEVTGCNKAPKMASPATKDETKSLLSLQLEEFDRGTFMSKKPIPRNVGPPTSHDHPPKSISNERLFLRKLSHMISDERWIEMNELLKSPAEVAAHRSGFEVTRSPPRWDKSAQGNCTSSVLRLASSMNHMHLGASSLGNNDLNPMEVLHFACRFNPPRTILRHLALLYPEGACYPDKMGRLPLHHAARWNASYRLINYLVAKDKPAALTRDNLGRTPLHLLCENYSPSLDPNNDTIFDITPEENMVKSLNTLIEAAPDAVNIEDSDGTTVIEYAIASSSPYDAVRLIQKASELDWKERKKASGPGEDSHGQIEDKLIREQERNQDKQEMDRKTKRMNDASMWRMELNNNVQSTARKTKTRSTYARTA
mmetsp:Transcript_5220/g.11425  ORF Transcript_5220/g.11425 Transcript_5220/m.11425 type:complete len:391 (+) Transcript_5220:84-1256(+)